MIIKICVSSSQSQRNPAEHEAKLKKKLSQIFDTFSERLGAKICCLFEAKVLIIQIILDSCARGWIRSARVDATSDKFQEEC